MKTSQNFTLLRLSTVLIVKKLLAPSPLICRLFVRSEPWVMAVMTGGDIRNAVADYKLEKHCRSLLSELTLRYAVFYPRRPSSQKNRLSVLRIFTLATCSGAHSHQKRLITGRASGRNDVRGLPYLNFEFYISMNTSVMQGIKGLSEMRSELMVT